MSVVIVSPLTSFMWKRFHDADGLPATPYTPPEGQLVTTIKDVAAHAGVGIGTVSRVLNDHPAVTEATRAKVRAAIASLNYHPSRTARALSRRQTGSLAIVMPFFTEPAAVERLRGVVEAVDESSFEIVLFNVDHASRRSTRFAQLARGDVADGALVLSLRPTDDEVGLLRARGLPVVFVDADVPGFPRYVVDDTEGGRLAGRHLLELGHERIGFVGDDVDPAFQFTSSARRRQGLAEALRDGGRPLDQRYVRLGPHAREVARQLAVELLLQPEPPTAIFAHSDTQALGVLEAAECLGRQVPDDLSVVGFDDIEAARVAGLTTVHQPLHESGRLGARRLLALLEGESDPDDERVELRLGLVERRSTQSPKGRRRATMTTRSTA